MSYFVTVHTSDTDDVRGAKIHNQKLNNYLVYGMDMPDDLIIKNKYPKLTKKKEVESQSTATTTTKNIYFVITTTLCCEDEENEERY